MGEDATELDLFLVTPTCKNILAFRRLIAGEYPLRLASAQSHLAFINLAQIDDYLHQTGALRNSVSAESNAVT